MPSSIQLFRSTNGLFCGALLCLSAALRADLIIEQPQGAPDEYRGGFDVHIAGFELKEATRITGLSGYFFTRSWPTGMSIVSDPYMNPEGTESLSFSIICPAQVDALPIDNHVPPGQWQLVENLRWDLPAGFYQLQFAGDGIYGREMPLAYPRREPAPGVGSFSYFEDIVYWHPGVADTFPFAARIYGTPLDAVPEPGAYGMLASSILLLKVLFRRSRATKVVRAILPVRRWRRAKFLHHFQYSSSISQATRRSLGLSAVHCRQNHPGYLVSREHYGSLSYIRAS